MDFSQLQTEVKDWINFNSSGTQQDFTVAQLKKAINTRYKREVSLAQQHGGKSWFIRQTQFVWPASTLTVTHPTLPATVTQHAVYRFENTTDNDPGYSLQFGSVVGLHWKDHKTLQWGSTGPSVDTTIRVTYLASGEELVDEGQSPELIPAHLHELLVLSTAVYLRWKADEQAPQAWWSELNEMRMDFWKLAARSRPVVGNSSSEELGGMPFTVIVED